MTTWSTAQLIESPDTSSSEQDETTLRTLSRRLKQKWETKEREAIKDSFSYIKASIWDSAASPLAKPEPERRSSFWILQKWEGTVQQTKADSFVARLVDLQARCPDEEAEIPLDEISKRDFGLVQEGAVFYWSIGYLDEPDGQRIRKSSFQFRRMPSWSEGDIDRAQKAANEMLEALDAS